MITLRPLLLAISLAPITCLAAAPATDSDPATRSVSASHQKATGLWELYREARDADARILAADARSRSGQWSEREAFGQLLPQLTASGSANRTAYEATTSSVRYNGEKYAIGLSQVLYAPEVWHNYRRYQALARQQDAAARDTREQAALDLVDRYFKVLAARDELDLVEAELKAVQRNQAQLEAMLERQMATITDLLEITARHDELKASRIEAANALSVRLEGLAELIGHPVSEPLQHIDPQAVFVMPPRNQEEWVLRAIEQNPELQARREAVEAAQSALRQARAGHKPNVSLSLSAQRSNIGYESAQNPRTDTYVASVGVTLPLYAGGSTGARVASSDELLTAAEQDMEASRREVVRQTRTAYLTTESSQQRINASRTALVSARKSREASEHAFERGLKTAVDVLDSVRIEYRARRDLLKAQYDFILNLLALQRWSGSNLDVDIRRTTAWLAGDTGQDSKAQD